MSRILIFTLSALMLSAPALAQTAPGQRAIYSEKPSGKGDPTAISCYPSSESTSRIKKLDCRPNSEWAQIAADDNHTGVPGDRAEGVPVNVVHH